MGNPVLPNAQLSIIRLRPKVSAKTDELKTLGDHIRRRRKALRLPQREVAARLGTVRISVLNWENNYGEPQVRFLPAILAFLGYDPRPIIARNEATTNQGAEQPAAPRAEPSRAQS